MRDFLTKQPRQSTKKGQGLSRYQTVNNLEQEKQSSLSKEKDLLKDRSSKPTAFACAQ